MSNKKKPIRTNQEMRPRPSGRGLTHNENSRWQRIRSFSTRYRRVIIHCAVFLVLIGLFYFGYSQIVDSRPFHSFMALTARVTGFMLNITGRGVNVDDTLVMSSQFAFQIVDLCTAVMPMLIFTAAIIAYPSRIKEKLFGLLFGLIAIFIINQIRLVSLFFIGIYAPGIFETAHLMVWQSLMILLTIGLWLIWAYKYVRTSTG